MEIRIEKNQKNLAYNIKDNGRGFDVTAAHKGYGLRLVNERISLFNQSSKEKKINLKINSDKQGTVVMITLMNWLE